jgi:hypothetical protein
MFQIHGDGLSRNNLQNFFVVSGIEALATIRLYEAYFEKKWGNNVVSLKAGQLAADSEFGLRFETMEHGGKYPDTMPQAIKLIDAEGRSCIYVPITQDGKVVDSQGFVLDAEDE